MKKKKTSKKLTQSKNKVSVIQTVRSGGRAVTNRAKLGESNRTQFSSIGAKSLPKEKQKRRSYGYALVVNERDTKYFQTKEAAEAAAAKLSGEIKKIENYKIKKVS